MRWVNDTLPPRPRRRWLLMTTRLSISSLAGMTRTLVAVGTVRLASMLATTRAAAPLSGRVAGDPLCGSGALASSLVPRSVASLALRPLPRVVGSPFGFAAGGGDTGAAFSAAVCRSLVSVGAAVDVAGAAPLGVASAGV